MPVPTTNVFPALIQPSNIPGWDLVTRTCIVRLGPDLVERQWYTNSAHASLGITGIGIDTNTRQLLVYSDFVDGQEKILTATANVDATLGIKGVFVGASGGSAITKYLISSYKDFSGYASGAAIRPNGSCFDPDVDNLWIEQKSLKPSVTPQAAVL